MPVALDRRSYLGLSRARFSVDDAEPRRAFRRLGMVGRELRAVLRETPEGAAGVRRYHRFLFLGYTCSVLAALLAGAAAGSFLGQEVLGAMQAARELTPSLEKLRQLLEVLPEWRLAVTAVSLFLLAFAVDYLAYRSILETIDGMSATGEAPS
jgi:hypothetical protein